MHKCISALTEANPQGVVLAFDCSNAYNSLPRQHILSGLRARAPALLRFARCWLGGETTHLFWDGNSDAEPVRATSGVDQGCPLSPAFFAITVAGALGEINGRLQQLSPECRVFSYLDDIMVFAPPEHAVAAAQLVPAELARLGLTVNLDKTQAWTADPQAPAAGHQRSPGTDPEVSRERRALD